ncbi:MAG: helix-turn-helix domain-containing protein [Nanoarchaeota archaeon]
MIEELKEFGLSEKEAKVYLASLELGNTTASNIAIKSNLPRTLVYDLLERLVKLGLVSYAIKSNKKYFRTSAPEELSRILEEKQKAISEIMPQLQKMNELHGTQRPQIEIYEGKEGMKTVMDNILRSKTKEFLGYGSSRSSYEIIPAFMEEWHKRRIKQKTIMKVIYNNTKQTREKIKDLQPSLKYSHFKIMPIELESPTATIIYADKVIFQSWTKEPFAVVIESKEMAENQKRYFEKLWKIAKK